MRDLVERLRNDGTSWAQDLFNEAAATIAARDAEIERLRAALREIIEATKYVENPYARDANRIATRAEQKEQPK